MASVTVAVASSLGPSSCIVGTVWLPSTSQLRAARPAPRNADASRVPYMTLAFAASSDWHRFPAPAVTRRRFPRKLGPRFVVSGRRARPAPSGWLAWGWAFSPPALCCMPAALAATSRIRLSSDPPENFALATRVWLVGGTQRSGGNESIWSHSSAHGWIEYDLGY